MATTFTRLLNHFVFSTKNRDPIIAPNFEPRLHAYIVGISKNLGSWVIAINGTTDHIHMLVDLNKTIAVSKYMEEVKGESSRWMNKEYKNQSFHWQEGYAAFSIGESGVDRLTGYISRQKLHHQRKSFKEELLDLLKKYKIEYDERYIWT
jgi:putative transposase